jgi:LPXTG-motif cell wall-anchored protein
MKRALRIALALTVAALVSLGLAGAAGAQSADYPTEACTATTNVAPGAPVTVDCSGFPPGSTVILSLDGEVLGEVLVAPDGSLTTEFPAPAECGTYTLTATDGVTTQTTTIVVACAAATTGALPYTGNDSTLPLAQIGAGLLAAGAIVALTVRKRQHAAVKVDA